MCNSDHIHLCGHVTAVKGEHPSDWHLRADGEVNYCVRGISSCLHLRLKTTSDPPPLPLTGPLCSNHSSNWTPYFEHAAKRWCLLHPLHVNTHTQQQTCCPPPQKSNSSCFAWRISVFVHWRGLRTQAQRDPRLCIYTEALTAHIDSL